MDSNLPFTFDLTSLNFTYLLTRGTICCLFHPTSADIFRSFEFTQKLWIRQIFIPVFFITFYKICFILSYLHLTRSKNSVCLHSFITLCFHSGAYQYQLFCKRNRFYRRLDQSLCSLFRCLSIAINKVFV